MRLYTVYNYIIRYETNIIMIKYNNLLSFNIIVHNIIKYHRGNQGYTGCPKNNGMVNFQDFALINSYLFSPCWIEHLFFFIITPRSFNLVNKFLFYEYFLMDCHFRALPLSFHWWVAPQKME